VNLMMTETMDIAKQILERDGYTCVACKRGVCCEKTGGQENVADCENAADENTIYSSVRRGVAPLLGWLDEGISFRDYFVADKVIGKGAAFLYILLNAENVFGQVVSEHAYKVLKEHGINITYGELVPAIQNRDRTGFCPIESAVLQIEEPGKALSVIRDTLEQLRRGDN